MSLSDLSNNDLAAGLHEHIVEAESRADAHPRIKRLLQIAHRALDAAQDLALEEDQVTLRAGGEKGP